MQTQTAIAKPANQPVVRIPAQSAPEKRISVVFLSGAYTTRERREGIDWSAVK
jgi:hypothetical protein